MIPHAYTQSRSPSASTTSVGVKIGAGFWRGRYSIKELLVEGELYWFFGSLTFSLSIHSVYEWPKMNPAMLRRMLGSEVYH
jgi:hypothetical protein